MRGLSLLQPWASMVAWDEKRIETRSWATNYRGQVAIHASKGFPKECRAFAMTNRFVRQAIRDRFSEESLEPIALGAIIAVATLVDVFETDKCFTSLYADQRIELSEKERALGDYSPGRYAWVLKDVAELARPVRCRGSLGLWTISDSAWEQVIALVAAEAAGVIR